MLAHSVMVERMAVERIAVERTAVERNAYDTIVVSSTQINCGD